MSQTVTHHKVTSVLFMKTSVHRVPNMSNYYFQSTYSSPMESDCPCNKKQGPTTVAFH
jgi:hypothetical protein